MQHGKRRSAVYEYRDLDPERGELPTGSVVVIFHDGDVDELAREMDRCRSRFGGVGLLAVVPPEAPAGFERIGRHCEGPWDLIRPDATVDEWRMRTDRLAAHSRQLGELEELRYRASHDERTGLLRPVEFERRFEEQFSAARRQGHELTLVLLDLDRFGSINKDFDHTVGDRIIARVGAAVRHELRTEDVGGRLGGDEFAILLPYTGGVPAGRLVERLRRALGEIAVPVQAGHGPVRISASFGVETYPGPDLSTVAGLRGHAELALRAAKRGGGDRAVSYRTLAEASGSGRATPDAGSTLVGEPR